MNLFISKREHEKKGLSMGKEEGKRHDRGKEYWDLRIQLESNKENKQKSKQTNKETEKQRKEKEKIRKHNKKGR